MALKKIGFITSREDDGKRLDQILAERLPEKIELATLSRTQVRKLIIAGAVYLNRKRVRIASKIIFNGAKLEVLIDLDKMRQGGAFREPVIFQFTKDRILFEDEYLVIVDKPAGIPTQPTIDEARINLFAALKKYYADFAGALSYIGLHHRLDRDTSGVVLFTKVREINGAIADLFVQHKIEKKYQALTLRPDKLPEDAWSIKNYLGQVVEHKPEKGSRKGKPIDRFGAVPSGGLYAHTDFLLREVFTRGLWIEAHPRTGRTHQIRVHLSEAGMPILGDSLYGKGSHSIRTMLHADSLTFLHPVTNLKMTVQSPLPEDFKKCLQALKEGDYS